MFGDCLLSLAERPRGVPVQRVPSSHPSMTWRPAIVWVLLSFGEATWTSDLAVGVRPVGSDRRGPRRVSQLLFDVTQERSWERRFLHQQLSEGGHAKIRDGHPDNSLSAPPSSASAPRSWAVSGMSSSTPDSARAARIVAVGAISVIRMSAIESSPI